MYSFKNCVIEKHKKRKKYLNFQNSETFLIKKSFWCFFIFKSKPCVTSFFIEIIFTMTIS